MLLVHNFWKCQWLAFVKESFLCFPILYSIILPAIFMMMSKYVAPRKSIMFTKFFPLIEEEFWFLFKYGEFPSKLAIDTVEEFKTGWKVNHYLNPQVVCYWRLTIARIRLVCCLLQCRPSNNQPGVSVADESAHCCLYVAYSLINGFWKLKLMKFLH